MGIYFILVILCLILTGSLFLSWTPAIKFKNSVRVYEQVSINGAKHQLMIRGVDKNNPILVFVHGGPGCSEIPYVRKYQDILEQKFTIVHYDQRGTGKSYHFFKDYSNLSPELLTDDLIALTRYIRKRFGKDKVLLAGHSFGSYIGMVAAAKAPENYIAYIGIGQVSNFNESETDSLNYCIEEANKAGNKDDIANLEKIRSQVEKGDTFVPRKYIGKYGGGSRLIDEDGLYTKGYLTNREYNLLDIGRLNLGVKKSVVMIDDLLQNPLPSLVKKLEIPCYFHMGQYDYKASAKAAKNYFDSITSPEKEFILYSESAHYPQFEEKEKFAEWLIKKFSN
ncbi:alpha/beta hydrolase [Clostridium estertheticum]|uniref:alpha/beta hydrolase n=1 Tax=Clostridium estertheticum TaxID=238834 RepID=UPI0013E97B7A|nr:alpha/beta hydrolase [Clostridium estertheticum]MBZ9685880.1 alpha/beta hydrolase [Clostridium estertheticum]